MFLFYSKKEEIKNNDYDLVVHIRKDVNSKNELFEMFSSKLEFPTYFGKNWDAFYDCLCDLEHLHKEKILILHEDLPFKESEEERKIYTDLLFDVESCFSSDPNHKVDIAFPMAQKNNIINRQT
jgi:RNAse (barnase) inhibitor barstar